MKNKTKTPNVEGLLAKIVETKTKMENPKLAAGARRVLGLALIILVAAFTKACNGDPQPKPLTGTVNIDGKMEVGEEVIANIVGSNATGGFTYQWTRTPDGGLALDIVGADEKHYIITEADVGHRLGAVVGTTDNDFIGTRKGKSTDIVGNPTKSFTIGGVSFTFEHEFADTTSWGKINTIAETYNSYIGVNPGSYHAGLIERLLSERTGANFRIIVDYSEAGKAVEFTAIDGQTLTVGSKYLEDTDLLRGDLGDAFEAMLDKPWSIPVAMFKAPVPQYNRAMQLRDNRIASKQVRQRLG